PGRRRRRGDQDLHPHQPVPALSGRRRRGGARPLERPLAGHAEAARLHRIRPRRRRLHTGRMKRVISTLIVFGAVAAAAVLMGAKASAPQTKTVKIAVDNAFGLTPGGALTIGGVRAGNTPGFSLTHSAPPKTVVTASPTQKG